MEKILFTFLLLEKKLKIKFFDEYKNTITKHIIKSLEKNFLGINRIRENNNTWENNTFSAFSQYALHMFTLVIQFHHLHGLFTAPQCTLSAVTLMYKVAHHPISRLLSDASENQKFEANYINARFSRQIQFASHLPFHVNKISFLLTNININ